MIEDWMRNDKEQHRQPRPVVTNKTITITLPLKEGQVVGRMTATNNPTSWRIVSVTETEKEDK